MRNSAAKSAGSLARPVCTENSDSHVAVMQSAEERMRSDATAERGARMERLCPTIGAFSDRCNSGQVAESYVIHRERLATRAADYDPFVRSRIELGRALSAADYMAMFRDRTALVRAMDARLADLDALVLPTRSIVAPTIAEVSSSESLTAKNLLVLRNPAIVKFFDLCAISLPLPRADALPQEGAPCLGGRLGSLDHVLRDAGLSDFKAYVKPYVKRQKNDAADAEALCEAVTRANTRFVSIDTF